MPRRVLSTVRAVDMGLSAPMVGGVLTANAFAYMLSCQWVGRILSPRNAAPLLIIACLATAAVTAGFVILPGALCMYALMVALGCTTAFFFVPFQVFMKQVDQGKAKSVGFSTGLYTFSWSIGFALGPFIAGFLWTHGGWKGTYLFCCAAALATTAGVYLLKRRAEVDPPNPPRAACPPEAGRRGHILAHDAADRAVDLRFNVLVIRADIADMREGEGDDLPGVGGIGHHLLIAGHRGVEAHLAHRAADRAEALAPDHGAIRQNEDSRRAFGLRVRKMRGRP